MKYNKDIVSFDCETTGLDSAKDYIIQLGITKFNVSDDGDLIIIDQKKWDIQPSQSYVMSLGAYFKHGIKPADLEGKPFFRDVAREIIAFCDNCDVLTYNGFSLDIPFLETEMRRCGMSFNFDKRKCYDAYKEEQRRNSNTLGDVYKRYVGEELVDAHSALADAEATAKVFCAQQKIQSYDSEVFIGIDGFIDIREVLGVSCYCFAYGKYKGVPIKTVKVADPSYISWIMSNDKFSTTTKNLLSRI